MRASGRPASGRRRRRRGASSRSPAATRWRPRPIARRRDRAQVRPGDRRRRPPTSRRAPTSTPTTSAMSALREGAGAGAGASARSRRGPSRAIAAPTARSGVRNYIGVLTSVNCSATVARHIAEAAERTGLLDDYPNVDGVVPITHASGCGMAGVGRGLRHAAPHALGHGGEPQLRRRDAGRPRLRGDPDRPAEERLRPRRRRRPSSPSPSRTTGGTRRAIEEGLERLQAMLPLVGAARRTTVPASELSARPAMRRLGRLVRRHLQPGAGRRLRPAGRPRRHGDPVRDAGDLRRRAPADRPRRLDRRSPTSCARASPGGRATPPATARRWTTTPRPATRPAA